MFLKIGTRLHEIAYKRGPLTELHTHSLSKHDILPPPKPLEASIEEQRPSVYRTYTIKSNIEASLSA